MDGSKRRKVSPRSSGQGVHFISGLLTEGEQVRHRARPAKRSGAERVLRISNVRILRGERLVAEDLWIKGDRFIDPQQRFWSASTADDFDPDEIINGQGMIVAPGFIDLQINGAFGVDYSNTETTFEQVGRIKRYFIERLGHRVARSKRIS